jgi:hypothetical protein
VGLTGLAALGEPAEGPMACIHAADEGSARNAEAMLLEAYRWG